MKHTRRGAVQFGKFIKTLDQSLKYTKQDIVSLYGEFITEPKVRASVVGFKWPANILKRICKSIDKSASGKAAVYIKGKKARTFALESYTKLVETAAKGRVGLKRKLATKTQRQAVAA